MATTQTKPAATTIHLPTQDKRASFVRKELRKQGLSVQDVSDGTGKCWMTVAKYARLVDNYTKDPRTDTTKDIFHFLGYDMVFKARKKSKGTVSF
jgi:hypothetical protein